jgi:site-specific recombinase XerD
MVHPGDSTGAKDALPMIEAALLEPSFADAAAAIEPANDVPARTRSHWLCSLRQIAKMMDRPMESIPARWTATRFPIGRLHHARVGANPKTLANHKSNVRAALLWFAKEENVPSRGMPLTNDWKLLRGRLPDRRARSVLSSMMRYCSGRRIAPAAVDEAVIDSYMSYRAETTALACNAAARRAIARTWNGCIDSVEGWPVRRLVEPPIKAMEGPAWENFPEGLRSGVEAYLSGLTRIRRSAKGKRIRPCRPSTIRTRRAELAAAARMAVRLGTPIASLTSLGALLHPDVALPVIDSYWKADGTDPSIYTIDLGGRFLSIARETGCVDEAGLERLDEMRASLDFYRRGGLTEKNVRVVRQILSGDVWTDVINLPRALMAQARSLRQHARVKAAVTAQMAVGIAILTFAPVRLSNLVHIRLCENLIKPGGLDSPYMLVFPHYDVKNRVDLQFPFDDELTALIDEYVRDFRSSLLRGSNDLWLFPGETGGCKDAKTFSGQITERIDNAIGLCITVHQFRHAAAAIYLKHHPGDYETVRRVLGHRSIQTTIKFYCGLETMQANKIFGDIVRKQMTFVPEPA